MNRRNALVMIRCVCNEVAEAAAWRLGLPPGEIAELRRAAWLHDMGRVGVSAAVWEKPGRLTSGEWEQVRLHSYHTERLLARIPALADLAAWRTQGLEVPVAVNISARQLQDTELVNSVFRALQASSLPAPSGDSAKKSWFN